MVALPRTVVLIVAALLAFGPSVAGGFQWDDYTLLAQPAVASRDGLQRLLDPMLTRPLSFLSFRLSWLVSGEQPAAWHAVNLALHTANVVLLSAALRRLVDGELAWWAALLFALHPVQAEPVNYIYGRASVLAATGCLLALWCWSRERVWAAVACFALAALAKEEALALPLALGLLDHWRGRAARWRPLAAMMGVALAVGLRAVWATAVLPGAQAGFQAGVTPWAYLWAQGGVVPRYLQLLVAPWGLSIAPAVWPPAAWLLVIALLAGLWRARTTAWARWTLLGLVLLTPSSSVFPAADLAADRRMYVPMIAFSVVLGAVLLRGNKVVRWLAAGTLLLVSMWRTQVWNDPVVLWQEARRWQPEAVRPLQWLARSLPPSAAMELLLDSPQVLDWRVQTELGRLYLQAGRPELALPAFGRALAAQPDLAEAISNRGTALAALGQREAAIRDFRRALQRNPCLFDARYNLRQLREEPPPAVCPWTDAERGRLAGC